jgi:hypothetical protein
MSLGGMALLVLWWPLVLLPSRRHEAPSWFASALALVGFLSAALAWWLGSGGGLGLALLWALAWALWVRCAQHLGARAASLLSGRWRATSVALGGLVAFAVHAASVQGLGCLGLVIVLWAGNLAFRREVGLNGLTVGLCRRRGSASGSRLAELSMGLMMASLPLSAAWCLSVDWPRWAFSAWHLGLMAGSPLLLRWLWPERLYGPPGVLLVAGGFMLWCVPGAVGLMLCMGLHAMQWAMSAQVSHSSAVSESPFMAWLWPAGAAVALAILGQSALTQGPVLFEQVAWLVSATGALVLLLHLARHVHGPLSSRVAG